MFYRSLLFVPGNRPDRFEKACAAGADLVCIDLEDAVGQGEKAAARKSVLAWLKTTPHKNVSLRINGVDTDIGWADIAALSTSGLKLPFIMVPKVAHRSDMEALSKALPDDLGLFFAIIESAKGLMNSGDIFAHPRVAFGLYGAVDYAGDVGCNAEWDTHLFARSQLVMAAATHDVMLFDVPYLDVRDPEGCEAATLRSRGLGIYARSAIHPGQIDPIHRALAPSAEEIAQAERIVAADKAAGGNVVLLDGKFVEAPVVKQAKRVLAWRNSS